MKFILILWMNTLAKYFLSIFEYLKWNIGWQEWGLRFYVVSGVFSRIIKQIKNQNKAEYCVMVDIVPLSSCMKITTP